MNDEDYERLLLEMNGLLPPNSADIDEYCKSISKRLKSLPPIPKDLLHLHDAVFPDNEEVNSVEIKNSIDLFKRNEET